MTNAIPTTTAATSQPVDLSSRSRPSILHLVRAELRKSLDTRAGRWFAAALALLAVTAAIYRLTALVHDGPLVAVRIFDTPWEVVGMLLPVLGVVSMTSEWSQRTALTTFALVPRRGRVLTAKLGATLTISAATVLFTAGVAAAVAVVGGRISGQQVQWHGLVPQVTGALAGGACLMGLGAALGVLLQQTGLALVVYFIAPTLTAVVSTALVSDRVAVWFAPTEAISRVEELDLTGAVAPSCVALLLWIALPLAVGAVRWLRREVS